MFLDKKTLLKIWLNPGLNLNIFRGTGPSCYLIVLSFILFFGSENYNGEHRVAKKELKFLAYLNDQAINDILQCNIRNINVKYNTNKIIKLK